METIKTLTDKSIKKITSAKGRAVQMNTGSKIATGHLFLFLHADTYLPKNALKEIRKISRLPNFVAGAFDLKIDSLKLSYRILSKISSLRSRFFRIPFGDQALFFLYFYQLKS